MLNCEVLPDRGIVILTPDGKVGRTDFSKAAEDVDSLIASRGRITGLMIRAQSYQDWADFADLVEELRFIQRRGVPVDRVAGLSDGNLEKHLPAIADRLETREYRHFPFEDREAALDWLESGR